MKIPLSLPALLSLTLALACSQPAANGLLCSAENRCPSGFKCYPTSAMENRCFDRALLPCPPGAALCEDFEGFAGWYINNHNDSTLSADAMYAHTGLQSLHTAVYPHDPSAPPPNNISQAQATKSVSIAPDIFMRFFLYQPAILPNDVEIAALQENRGDFRGASLWLQSGRLEVDAPIELPDQTTPEELLRRAEIALPVNQWICIEWQLHAAIDGELRVWVDEQEQTALDLPADTSLVVPASGEGTVVVAGLGLFTDDTPPFTSYDVWYDDIAVSSQRIHCF